jgi:hypothetical protein
VSAIEEKDDGSRLGGELGGEEDEEEAACFAITIEE